MLLGEVGLRPTDYKSLSWPEVDHILIGYARRQQLELVGLRRIATMVYNFFPADDKPLTDEEYLPLPLVDRPRPAAAPVETQEAFFERLRARGLTPVP